MVRIKFSLFVLIAFLFVACNKEEDMNFDTNAKLSFSTDSILFDTVFTAIGSTTKRLKVYNKNSNAILINNIKLSGGNPSSFSININGQATSSSDLIKINGGDSINVFVKINVNPNNLDLPFLVQDSILFSFNDNKVKIPLIAYGQNANFMTNQNIIKDTVWDSKLPYIIYNSVSIEEDVNLTLAAGTRILFHSNGTMNVKGTLTANGTKKDSIVFASDRLEKIYADESGQWNGIHFYPTSKNSKIDYAIIKNGVAGITLDSLSRNTNPKLLLTNSIIKNMEVVGFLGYHTDLNAFNNLFTNCGQYLIYGVGGGKYNVKQNTFVALNVNYPRKAAAVYFSDFISSSSANNFNLEFINNIVWGNLIDEFVIDKKSLVTVFNAVVKNNLLKTSKTDFVGSGNINKDPMFINSSTLNFKPSNLSPGLKMGLDLRQDYYFNSFLNKDLNHMNRVFPFDIGCYENK